MQEAARYRTLKEVEGVDLFPPNSHLQSVTMSMRRSGHVESMLPRGIAAEPSSAL